METHKILNIMAGMAGIASLAMPTLGFFRYEAFYWMFGIFVEEGDVFILFEEIREAAMAMASLTIMAGFLIAVGATMFLVSLAPNLKTSTFTRLGWIFGLTGCGVFLLFGFGADIDGPMFLFPTVYPIGLIASFTSGVLGVASWVLQSRVKKPFVKEPAPGKVQEILYRRPNQT